ncbi:unnamed protein product [Closterium sp. NIES-65]|nr:unnamed protein product [Closterium sp. NIES-65]
MAAKWVRPALLGLIIALSYARSTALLRFYSAPMHILEHLPAVDEANEDAIAILPFPPSPTTHFPLLDPTPPPPFSSLIPRSGHGVLWHGVASLRHLLPPPIPPPPRAAFIDDGFKGLLPIPFNLPPILSHNPSSHPTTQRCAPYTVAWSRCAMAWSGIASPPPSSSPRPSTELPSSTMALMVTVCYGMEWHRFPTSFLLPSPLHRAAFIDDGFKGLLPIPFDPEQGGTESAPSYFNDKNQATPEQFVSWWFHGPAAMPIPFDPEAGEAESAPAYFNDKYQATPEQSVRRGKLVLSRAFWKFKRGSIPTARPLSLPPTSPPSRPSLAPLSRQLDECLWTDLSLCDHLVELCRGTTLCTYPSIPSPWIQPTSLSASYPSVPLPPWHRCRASCWTSLCAAIWLILPTCRTETPRSSSPLLPAVCSSPSLAPNVPLPSLLPPLPFPAHGITPAGRVLASLPFVDAQRSPALYRAFFIPGLSERLVNSCVTKGYFQDPFVKLFVRRPARRSPVIHRGYFARWAALQQLVDQFLSVNGSAHNEDRAQTPSSDQESQGESRKSTGGTDVTLQIISLGAGFDTLFFRLQTEGKAPHRFIEVDFQEVVAKKADIINAKPELAACLGPDVSPLEGAGLRSSNGYSLVSADLRDTDKLNEALAAAGADFGTNTATLFLCECVLIYMDAPSSHRLVAWAAEKFGTAAFVVYEQIRPDDAFGQQMIQNLEIRPDDAFGQQMIQNLEVSHSLATSC